MPPLRGGGGGEVPCQLRMNNVFIIKRSLFGFRLFLIWINTFLIRIFNTIAYFDIDFSVFGYTLFLIWI